MVLIHHSVLHSSLHALCRLHSQEPLLHVCSALHHPSRGPWDGPYALDWSRPWSTLDPTIEVHEILPESMYALWSTL